jgi:hypothetical protein
MSLAPETAIPTLDAAQLLLRQQFGFDRVNPDFVGDRFGGTPAVAGQHHLAHDAERRKLAHGFAGALPDAIAQQDGSDEAIAVGDQYRRGSQTVRFESDGFGARNAHFGHELRVSRANCAAV